MTGQRKASLWLGAAALLCVAAYASASYLLQPALVDAGGGHAHSSSFQVDCSIGGSVIAEGAGGTATSATYTLDVNSVSLLTSPATGGGGDGGDDGGDDPGGFCVPGAGSPATMLLAVALLFVRGRH